jgi:hypothetical protein
LLVSEFYWITAAAAVLINEIFTQIEKKVVRCKIEIQDLVRNQRHQLWMQNQTARM